MENWVTATVKMRHNTLVLLINLVPRASFLNFGKNYEKLSHNLSREKNRREKNNGNCKTNQKTQMTRSIFISRTLGLVLRAGDGS
jgi:hypothetical protein